MSLFNHLKQLNLNAQNYAIFGSGPLAIRKIIPSSNDLDILCRRDVWDTVCQLGKCEYLEEYDVTIVNLPHHEITFGTVWGIGNFNVNMLINTAEIIDGLPFVQLQHVVHYKKIRGSAKDLAHLQALKKSGKNFR